MSKLSNLYSTKGSSYVNLTLSINKFGPSLSLSKNIIHNTIKIRESIYYPCKVYKKLFFLSS